MLQLRTIIYKFKPKHTLYAEILLTLFAFLAMTVLSFFFMRKIVHDQLIRNTETIIAFEQVKTGSDVLEHANMLEIISHTVRSMILHGYDAVRLQEYYNEISASLSKSEKHKLCFMGTSGYFEVLPDGPAFIEGFVWDRPDNFVPQERPWYKNALAAGGDVAETLSYSDIVTGETALIYSQCIFDDEGRRLGVTTLRIRMAALGREIVETALAQGGYGMLISRDLVMIAHENPEFIGRDIRDPEIPASIFADELLQNSEISEHPMVSYKNEKSVAFFRKLENGWYFGLVVPKGPYYQGITNMALILSALGITFAATLIYILVHIDEAKNKSSEESRQKSAFLANMSHEIRTPMNAIIGMTAIGKGAADIERKDNCFAKIEDASKHLLGVINDILDISKIEANKFELSPVEFDFEKILQRVVNVVNFRVDEKHQKFKVHIDRAIPKTLIGDDQRLAQVITNLLGNAVKFTPEKGSVSLVTRFLREDNGLCTIQIAITDTGIGISPAQQANLFQAFQQAESSTTRKYGGTGLGLAISKRIVEMMGGRIWIESELGKGATFAFTVQLKHGSEKAQSFFDQDVNWKNVRILVIDDSVDILEYFREITHGYGVICDTAISGEEALRLVDQNGAYHIYFVDWKMPGMDSLELTKELKARSSEKSVVIMMSAADWNAIEEKAKKAGVDKFLSKPLFPSFIVDTMNEALGLDRQQIEKAQTDISGIFADHCILLAEDVEINREIVLALLEPSQMKIDCAENGAEAVQKFIESPGSYDMIFMDVQMPEMDGFEATRRIRALDIPNAKTIPIVAMTANVFKEDIDNSLNAGMNDHIGKPLDFNVLLKKLHKYLPEKSITGIV